MRANTQKIFERLSKGAFLSVDSTDLEIKSLYDDIEENYADYETYFLELGLRLDTVSKSVSEFRIKKGLANFGQS